MNMKSIVNEKIKKVQNYNKIIRVQDPRLVARICDFLRETNNLSNIKLAEKFNTSKRMIERIKHPDLKKEFGIYLIKLILEIFNYDPEIINNMDKIIFLYNAERMSKRSISRYRKELNNILKEKDLIDNLMSVGILTETFYKNIFPKLEKKDSSDYNKRHKINELNLNIEALKNSVQSKPTNKKIHIIATSKNSETIKKLAQDFNSSIINIQDRFEKYDKLMLK